MGSKVLFSRKTEVLKIEQEYVETASPAPIDVLVINDSQSMAKEMTLQLTLTIPGCSITYAPSLELANWILRKREFSLIVSSPVLPDGGIARLRQLLSSLSYQPDLVVVGEIQLRNAVQLQGSGYEVALCKRLAPQPINKGTHTQNSRRTEISSLGADLRNDLNNPLQEIVAMVFVAQATGQLAESTSQALEAIDKAAKNMAHVVNGLENKISERIGNQ